MAIGVWANQGTVKALISTRNMECSTILYDINPVILPANGDGHIFKMWASTINGPCYAESADGVTWTDYVSNPLLAGIVSTHESKVHKQGSTYYLFDGPIPGGPIAVYTSSDGVTFTVQNATAIAVGAGGSVDAQWAGQLAVVDVIAGTWFAYYSGQQTPGGGYVMIQATSSDGITWTKNYGNQITTLGPSNFDFHLVGGRYYGWSQIVPSGIPTFGSLGLPSDVMRFSSPSASGPWTALGSRTLYRTLASEGVGLTAGQVADPSIVEALGNVYIFFTAKSAGNLANNGIVNMAIASSTTLANIVTTYEGLVNIPIPWGTNSSPLQLVQTQSDNFNRADQSPLSGNWSTVTSLNPLQLLSNQVTSNTVSVAGDMYYNAAAFPNDQWAQIALPVFSGAAICFGGVLLRASSVAGTDYRIFLQSTSNAYFIQKYVAGTPTTLKTAAATTIAAGDIVTGSAIGTQISIYDNGNLIWTLADATTAAGSAGIIVKATTSLSNAAGDNWVAGGVTNPVVSASALGAYGPIVDTTSSAGGAYGQSKGIGSSVNGGYGPSLT